MAAAARVVCALPVLRTSQTNALKTLFLPTCSHIQQMNYAKPLGGKRGAKGRMGPAVEKVRLPVETDPEKLKKYVCGSHPVKEGRQDVEIKADSEYPDWLWELRMGRAPPLEELDKSTKQYWRRLRSEAMKENNIRSKLRKF